MLIGTMIRGCVKSPDYLKRFIPIGIESVQFSFWNSVPKEIDERWMESVAEICQKSGIIVSSLCFFTNPLAGSDEYEAAEDGWRRILMLSGSFGIPLISGFTGRIPGRPVEESLKPVERFFTPLLEECIHQGVKLAFENCPMEGTREAGNWNIAFAPDIWDLLFHSIFKSSALGLEFDPSHCPALGQDALALAEVWLSKIVHVHGKDTLTDTPNNFCFPGKGRFDWRKLSAHLLDSGYSGSLDLEGYHGTFVSHEVEVAAQKESLSFLKGLRAQLV